VSNIASPDSTVVEVAADYLIHLSPQDREKAQREIYKFIRWLGLHRKVDELSPLDIASYAEQITSSETKPVKSFLTYIRRKGFSKVNLAVHLRVKKTSRKAASPQQNLPGQTALTAQGYAKLEKELADLKNQRSDVTEEIRRAAADKDFRENAPLAAARERQSTLEGRIQELESTLKSATIMAENQSTSKIKIGDTVVLYDLPSGKQLHYILVDPREANPTKGRISVASPIGKALLGKEKGQTIEVIAPAGTFSYRIEDVQLKTP
jgi:transcription elongation factor GreA